MTIKEFTDLFHFSKDTVRYYREKGVIIPNQNENNGYFSYSSDEAAILYQVAQSQKFKCNQVLLINDIDNLGTETMYVDLNTYINASEKIDAEIKRLKEIKKSIRGKIKYREDILNRVDKIEINKKSVGLHYYTEDQFKEYSSNIDFLYNEFKSYIGVTIPLKEFNNSSIKEYAPKFCIGLTSHNMKYCQQENVVLTGCKEIKDNQISLRCVKKLNTLQKIPSSVFDDVKNYAFENNFIFADDVTSIILTSAVKEEYAYFILFRFIVTRRK